MSFEFVSQNDFVLVKLTGPLLGDESPNLYESFVKSRESGHKFYVLQMADCNEITPQAARQMSAIYKDLKGLSGGLRLVAPTTPVKHFISSQGLNRILMSNQSLRGALVDFGLAKATDMDVKFINPFLEATQKVFDVQCQIKATPQAPTRKSLNEPLLMGDISGIIAIASETFNGTLAISMSESIFLQIANNMLGEKCDGINEGNMDLVGELSNMILGQAKSELGRLGYAIQRAHPSCVWGKNHKVKHFSGGTCIVLPFATSMGSFYVEIMTEQLQVKLSA